MKSKKTPIGILPKWLYEQTCIETGHRNDYLRMVDLSVAIKRYIDSRLLIPDEWLEE